MTPSELEHALAHTSKAVQRLNADLARVCPRPEDLAANPKKRIRQDSKPKLNKTEAAALAWLSRTMPGYVYRTHEVTLTLANGCKYTPDICGFARSGHVRFWEVKGKHAWDDAIVKLKVAARYWSVFSFSLMWRSKSGWNCQDILP